MSTYTSLQRPYFSQAILLVSGLGFISEISHTLHYDMTDKITSLRLAESNLTRVRLQFLSVI